jgi:hypothetical protein
MTHASRIGIGGFLLSATIFFAARQPVLSQSTQASPTFQLAIGGAFLRDQPRLTAPVTAPVFEKNVYKVIARTPDSVWFKLEGERKEKGWALSSLGETHGSLYGVPIESGTVELPARSPTKKPTAVTSQARKLYQQSIKSGRRADLFTVIGDCNAEPNAYLWRLTAGTFDVSKRAELHSVVSRFFWSFTRGSKAALGGFNTASMFDDAWSDPAVCKKGEGPISCELRVSKASIVIIALGTGDTFMWKDFEERYRAIIEYVLQEKAVPILMTKADDLESQEGKAPPGHINGVVKKLGAEYGIPVIDFWRASRGLPNFGMRQEGNENFHMSPAGSDLRLLLTLQTLDAITK